MMCTLLILLAIKKHKKVSEIRIRIFPVLLFIFLAVIFFFIQLFFFLIYDYVYCGITDNVQWQECHFYRTVDCNNQCVSDHTCIRCPSKS